MVSIETKGTNDQPRRRRRGKKANEKRAAASSSSSGTTSPSTLRKDSSSSSSPYPSFASHGTPLLVFDENEQHWWELGRSRHADRDAVADPGAPPSPAAVVAFRAAADALFAREVSLARGAEGASADDRWVETTMRRGTTKDRVAAGSVTMTRDPVHRVDALDRLLGMLEDARSASSSQRVRMRRGCVEALRDVFVETYLPPTRRLIGLTGRPLEDYRVDGGRSLSPRVLLLWRFEETLRDRYGRLLGALERAASTREGGADDGDAGRIDALRAAAYLLSARPEGEDRALRLVAHKIGDPSRKVAAAAGHALRGVTRDHPAMTPTVAREVMQTAHRPGARPRARHACAVFLNQIRLDRTADGAKLAGDLVACYLRLFEAAVRAEEDDRSASRLLGALLTGVERARPFLSNDADAGAVDDDRVDALFKVAHSDSRAAARALALLHRLCADGPRADRYHRAAYASLARDAAPGRRVAALRANLLYRTLKRDADEIRVVATAKRALHEAGLHADGAGAPAAALRIVGAAGPTLRDACRSVVARGRTWDAAARDPARALKEDPGGADAALWEVSLLTHHYHPSVARFARALAVDGRPSDYGGDPTRDFALGPFLDRFAYRRPKKRREADDDQNNAREAVNVFRKPTSSRSSLLPVNEDEFWSRNRGVEHDFFRRYFESKNKRQRNDAKRKDADHEEEDDDEVEALEFDENKKDAVDAIEKLEQDEWDTDEEEEEFANQLAEGLMEDGAADLDHEDPDTEGWDDLRDNDGDGDGEAAEMDFRAMDGLDDDDDGDEDDGGEIRIKYPDANNDDGSDDDDEDLDGQFSDDDDDDDVENDSVGEEEDDDDAFMDADDGSSDDDDEVQEPDEEIVPRKRARSASDDDDDDDIEGDLEAFVVESDDDDAPPRQNTAPTAVADDDERPKTPTGGAFGDADDYQELISKGWADRDQLFGTGSSAADDASVSSKEEKKETTTPTASGGGGKKKRRRARKRKS